MTLQKGEVPALKQASLFHPHLVSLLQETSVDVGEEHGNAVSCSPGSSCQVTVPNEFPFLSFTPSPSIWLCQTPYAHRAPRSCSRAEVDLRTNRLLWSLPREEKSSKVRLSLKRCSGLHPSRLAKRVSSRSLAAVMIQRVV